MLWFTLACGPSLPFADLPPLPPAPNAFEAAQGSGGPKRTFTADEIGTPCGYVLGGLQDAQHHNLAIMHDGYLLHPWAPEDGGGGISFFDMADPCNPVLIGQGYADRMRETHTLPIGQVGDREYLAVDMLDPDDGTIGGIGIWDITDRTAPVWVSELATAGFQYPDSYFRVTFSSFWQGPVLYVAAAFNGVHVVDVSNPLAPALVRTVTFDPPHLVGSFHVIGNFGIASSAGTNRAELFDVSDPWDPRPLPGGTITMMSDVGDIELYYFASIGGRYGLFARKDRGGGPIIFDLSDPTRPQRTGELFTEGGDGGYVYRQGDYLFQGDSNFGLVMDFTDPALPVEVARVVVAGDLDTISPIGNVMLASVDEGAADGKATSVFPWREAPDDDPPAVELVSPLDGITAVPLTSRIGLSFDEWVERASVFEGSFRVTDAEGWPIAGTYNVQENLVNFTPNEPLPASTEVRVVVPAGGITDISGNPTAEEVAFRFTTAR